MSQSQHTVDTVKHVADAAAASVAVGALFQWLPAIASIFTIVWLGIRIWETDTVRRMFNRPPLPPTSD